MISWQEEIRNAFKTSKELKEFLGLDIEDIKEYPVFIPRSFATLIKEKGKDSPLFKEFIPDLKESDPIIQRDGLLDPIGDEPHAEAKQIIHRYKNRALFLPTTKCPINCRYCFRKNELFSPKDMFKPNIDETLSYLKSHPEINEVIFSGGDPLFLSDQKIEGYLEEFSKIKTIKFIRFHSRFPVILPSRLDQNFYDTLTKFHGKNFKIILALHINHADEISDDLTKNIKNSPIPWISQTVLLKGINDSSEILRDLFYGLDELSIRPYYLHHPDHAKGAMHFYLTLEEGRKIYANLRDELPGWLLPHYVVDIPHGFGKALAFNSESFQYNGKIIDKNGHYQKVEL